MIFLAVVDVYQLGQEAYVGAASRETRVEPKRQRLRDRPDNTDSCGGNRHFHRCARGDRIVVEGPGGGGASVQMRLRPLRLSSPLNRVVRIDFISILRNERTGEIMGARRVGGGDRVGKDMGISRPCIKVNVTSGHCRRPIG